MEIKFYRNKNPSELYTVLAPFAESVVKAVRLCGLMTHSDLVKLFKTPLQMK